MYEIRLYVVKTSHKSDKTIKQLEILLEKKIGEDYKMEIIDVLEHPEMARSDKIFVTPTLVRIFPKPMKKVIGDLSCDEIILNNLGIVS